MPSYPRVNIIEFGKQLIDTQDLDPVYVALWDSKIDSLRKKQFILGWMQYYHCGLACWMLKPTNPPLLKTMLKVAENPTKFPMRGSQRKHHRKQPAIDSAQDLLKKFKSTKDFFDKSWSAGHTANRIFHYLCTIVGWGPCFAWRVPDLMEAEKLYPAKFTDADTELFFSSPKKGAILCAQTYKLNMDDPCQAAHQYLMEHLGHLKAPPSYTRNINIQETETVFCKWLSHMHGRYALGRDTIRARVQFEHEQFKELELCQLLLKHMPLPPT